jgi:hypothetical protein
LSIVCPECGYNAGDDRILKLHLSVTGHSLNPPAKMPPSGYYACSRHTELPPMTLLEFENHKTINDMADNSQRARNTQSLGIIGAFKNMGIESCESVPIPQGDPRLSQPMVPSIAQGQVVVVTQVLVACQYCGARAPQGTAKCPGCGANL